MPGEEETRGSWQGKLVWLAVIVPLVLAADIITKQLAIAYLKPLLYQYGRQAQVDIIEGFFRLKYTENPGAAWGLLGGLSEGLRNPFFIVVSLGAMAFLLWFFWRTQESKKLLLVALSFLLGGAAGNLVDRFRLGRVVDFIDWYIRFDSPLNLGLFTIEAGEKHWPTFNIADAAITVGVALVLVDMLFLEKKKPLEAA
jgi:signal peptidase II